MVASMETPEIKEYEDYQNSEGIAHLLVQEMHHRINNEYAFAVSAVSVRAIRSRDDQVKAALDEVVEMLMRMAEVHRSLTPPTNASVEMGGYLKDLCQAISNARLRERNISLFLYEEGELWLTSECCWKIGLAVSELITNSAKHAFGPGGGQIWIELEGDCSTLRCCVRDNGAKREFAPAGQGLRLIRSLTESIGGSFDWVIGDRGAMSVISIPRSEAISELN